MFQPSNSSLALTLVLASLAATAAQGAAARRAIVLTGTPGEAPVLYLAPDIETFVLLDASIERQSVEVEGRARFARVDPSEQGITLVLRTPLLPGEQLALRFSYREGSPRSAVFLLTGKPGVVDEVVHVRRPPQAVEQCRVELAATHERCEAQARELEALKARLPVPSPAAVALSDIVGPKGMKGWLLKVDCIRDSGGFRAEQCWALGAETWSVVVVVVSNTGTEPWVPAWAEVMPEAGGEPRRARTVLSTQASLLPGMTASVAIEVEMSERTNEKHWLTVLHSVRVCDAAGDRCVSVPRVKL
ncbi:MAG TPA: DUF2381 family protein [Myxococcaceae bacterium]